MKLCIYVTLCACLIFYSTVTSSDPALERLGDGEYCIYSVQVIESPLVTKVTDLGFSYIYHCDSSDAERLRKLFTQIDGESITLQNCSVVGALKTLRYSAVTTSSFSSITSTYAYSPRGSSYIINDNTKINLQIVQSGENLIVGWPVILGSY